jgi:hypothetical protein
MDPTALDFSAAIAEAPAAPAALPPPSGPRLDFTAAIEELPPVRPVVDTSKDEEQLALNLRWRVANTDRAPEEQAEVLRLSSALGWKPEMVAADLAGARGAVEAQKLDSLTVVRDHPVLAGFIGDPNKTALARSDYDRLSALEKLTGRDAVFADGKLQKAVPGWFGRTLAGRQLNGDTKSALATLANGVIEDKAAGTEYVYNKAGDIMGERGVKRPLTQADRDTLHARIAANDTELARLGLSGDTQFHENDYATNALANVAKIAIDMGPELVASAALGAVHPVLAATMWAAESRPDLYRQLSEAKKSDGTPLMAEREAADWALVGSIPMGAVMGGLPNAIGMGVGRAVAGRTAAVGAVERTVGGLMPRAIDKLMTDRTFTGVVGHLAKEYGEAQLHGGLIMGLQSGMAQATLEVAQATHGEFTDGRVMAAFTQGAIRGMEDFAVISAFRPVANAFVNYGRWQRSADLASTLKDIADNTRNSRMAKASPEEFDKLVTDMGPNQTVHVDLEAMAELAQKEQVAPRELASRIVGDNGEAFDKATADGSMLPVPLGKWATNVVQKGLHEPLALDITPDVNVPTRRAAAKEMAEAQAFLDKRWEERQADGVQVELDVLAEKMRAAAKRIKKSDAEADTFARIFRGAVEVAAKEFNVSVMEAAAKVRLPHLFLEELSGKSFGVLDGAERVAALRNAATIDAKARFQAASKAYESHPAATAWNFLRGNTSIPSLAPLVAKLRKQAVASGKATAPKELLAEIAKVQKRVAKAEGGATQGPLERRSATKRVPVTVEADPEGGASIRPHDGPEATHSVRVPAWLDAKDFAEHRHAWEMTWAALGGPDAPEHAQKLVYGYMRPSVEDGAAGPSKLGIMQAWAAGRLTQGLGGKGYAKVREALEKWAAEPEATRAEDPIDPKAWGGLLAKLKYDEKWVSSGKHTNKKKFEAFDKWLALASGEVDASRTDFASRPPAWYGKPGEVDAGAAKAAATEALRARLTELNAQAREAALAAAEVSPRLDFAEAAKVLGKDATQLPTEAGGLSADELASVLGVPDGASLLRDMVARRDRLAWIRGEAGRPTSLAVEVAKELGVDPVVLPPDLLADAMVPRAVPVQVEEALRAEGITRFGEEPSPPDRPESPRSLAAAKGRVKAQLAKESPRYGSVEEYQAVRALDDQRNNAAQKAMLAAAWSQVPDALAKLLPADRAVVVETWNTGHLPNSPEYLLDLIGRRAGDAHLGEQTQAVNAAKDAWTAAVKSHREALAAAGARESIDKNGARHLRQVDGEWVAIPESDPAYAALNQLRDARQAALASVRVAEEALSKAREASPTRAPTPKPPVLPAEPVVRVTTPETDAATTASKHDAELTNFLEQASLEGVIVTRNDGSIHFRNPESKVWLWTEVNSETDTLDVALLGVDGGPEGSPEWNAAVAAEKGKGYSSALYLRALQIAQLHGLGMRSDLSRTPATERMYKRLAELGIPFELNDEFIVDRMVLTAEQVAAVNVPAKWKELQARTKANIGELRQSNRGAIRMTLGPDGTPRDFVIRALAGDRSTLAHESSHFLSWSMHDMALDPAAPERLKADYAELLKFGGWKDANERLADNLERTKLADIPEAKRTAAESKRLTALEAREERISHAWEQYLAEGKPPAPELRSVFRRFRDWMGRIYGSIEGIKKQYRDNYGQELELSDEVRGVFDRLIAVDHAVEQASEGRVDYGALLNLTPEDAAAIAELRGKMEEEARDRLDRVSAKTQGKAAGAGGHLNAERELIRVSATQEYDESPGGITEHFLLTGTLRNKEGESTRPAPLASLGLVNESGRTMRLRYSDVEALAGPAVAEKLKAKGLTRDTGAHPDELALAFGWDSGAEMVAKLAEALPREQAIEGEVKARMAATFGSDLELVTETVRSEMARATHGPSDLQEALRVRAALARELGDTKAKLPAGIVRGAVDKAVAETKVGDVSPDFHLAAERKAAKRAFDLMAKAKAASASGRTEKSDFLYRQAMHEWDEVILNKHLVASSEEVASEVESMWSRVNKAGKKDWKASLGLADIAYSDATDAIRRATGFTEDGKPDAGAIERALEAMRRDGGDVFEVDGKLQADGWDADLIRELAANPKEWDELTVEQAREVHNAVENIKAVASGKNAVTLAGKKESRKNVVDATARSLARFSKRGLPRDPSALNPAQQAAFLARRFMASIDANLTEIEGLVDQVTGNDRTHPLWRFMVEERLIAQDKELALSGKFAQRVQDLWDQLPPETAKRLRQVAEGAGQDLPVPDTQGILAPNSPMSIGQLIMVALNMGNDGNKQRLLDGMGWTEAQVLKTLGKHLTKGELTWVQGVWTALADLYPLIEETHIADQGIRPEKVAASPLRIMLDSGEWVELEGGYFPARYDPRVPSKRPIPMADVDGAGALRTQFVRPPKVGNSHAQQRARENSDIVNLDFHVVPAHVAQVLHDVTHRLWVKEAAGLVMDPSFRTMLRGTLGQEYEALFPSYVRAVATKGATSVAGDTMRTWNAALSWAKRKATLGAVGFNISVAMADLTNPLLPLVAGEVSAERLASVTSQLAANWTDLRAFGLEHSVALRGRMHHGSNTGEAIESIVSRKGAKGWFREAEHAAYYMMETTDRMTATAIWLAKYQGLMADKTLEQAPEAHATAVREADALVRKYFPANDAASKAALLRDQGFFGQTAFLYGFASKVYNFNRRTIVEAADAWRETGEGAPSRAAVIGRAMFVIGAQAAVMGVAGDFLASRGPKKDDDAKGKAKWALARMASTVPYQLPIINYLSPGTARGGLPGTSLMTRLYSEVKGLGEGKVGGVELAMTLGAATVGGMAGVGQASKTGRYIDRGLKQDWQRHKAGSIASGLVFGQKASSELVTPLNMMEGK